MRGKLAAAALFAVSLGGCAGGGGGPSAPAIATVPFTSFAAVQPNQQVTFRGGVSAHVTGTNSGATITSVGPIFIDASADPSVSNTSGSMTYDSNKALSAASAVTPFGSISFSKSAGNAFTCTSGVCGLASSSASAVLMEPTTLPLGWNYQTFGVWDRATSATSFDAGAFSFGNVTPGSAIPLTGMATFVGIANGFFVDNATSNAFFTSANMSAGVNWDTRNIAFSTTNTQVVSLTTPGAAVANAGLNLSGTLGYSAGTNWFTGNVTSGNGLVGSANGRFYGPSAQEMGGVFTLTGANGAMMGSFGGKQ